MNGWLQDDRTEVLGECRGGLWLRAMSEDVTKIIRAVHTSVLRRVLLDAIHIVPASFGTLNNTIAPL
jgi:hypothetical protein